MTTKQTASYSITAKLTSCLGSGARNTRPVNSSQKDSVHVECLCVIENAVSIEWQNLGSRSPRRAVGEVNDGEMASEVYVVVFKHTPGKP